MDVAHGERVEKELDDLIERRTRQGEQDPDKQDPTYRESVRRYNGRRRQEIRALWYGYHDHMRELHARLAAEHEEKALALLQEGA